MQKFVAGPSHHVVGWSAKYNVKEDNMCVPLGVDISEDEMLESEDDFDILLEDKRKNYTNKL